MMSHLARLVSALLAAMLFIATAALAQDGADTPQRSPLGITLPSQAAGQKAAPPSITDQSSQPAATLAREAGIGDRLWAWMMAKQAQWKQSMSAAVRDLRSGASFYPAALICALAFAYGVLHAAGPGHGKAVISSYVLANERTLRRGIMLSFLSAFIQALSAIAFVGVLALVLKATSMTIRSTEAWAETLSWAFVALVGAWLLYRQVRLLWPTILPESDAMARNQHGQAHEHGDHHHVHGPECGCGHSHAPDPQKLDGELSPTKAFAIAFAVGIRPCTGALTLLFLTLTQGVLWVGILGTFAMALGTAITVSILACMAIGSRELAKRFSGEGSPWGWRIERAAGLTGSSLILLMGTVFFIGSLQQTAPL